MSLNVNNITSGVVNLVKEIIPHRLSTVKGQSGQLPAVMLERNRGPKPNFPYATVDRVGIRQQGLSVKNSYINEDDKQTDEFEYLIRVVVYVRGSPDHDTLGIAEELKSRISLPRNLNRLYELTGCTLLSSTDPNLNGNLMSTNFEEVTNITLDLLGIASYVDEDTTIITDVSTEGQLYEDIESDPVVPVITEVGPSFNP